MNPLKIVGFAGSYSDPSKTRAVVTAAAERAARLFGARPQVFDLNDLGPSLGSARRLGDLAPQARRHLDALLEADLLILASPVHKGSYTGLFKHLFDLLDPTALIGRPVLLAATGGGEKHALVIEHQLRPLLAFFEAQTLATGLYVSDRHFVEGRIADEPTLARLDRAVAQFAPFVAEAAPRPSRVGPSRVGLSAVS